MSTRSVVVRLKAEIGEYLSSMSKAGRAAEEAARKTEQSGEKSRKGMAGLTKLANEQRQSWDTVSTGLLKVGAVGVASLGLVTKAAIDWESAWAGVTKVVDGTPQQLGAIEEGLRGMARELPSTHEELASVAAAAGQLGIATPDVLAFTRTMIDMGVATNLSADEAATTMARFANIMQSTAEHGSSAYSRIGSAIVDLGNNSATTESEIFSMAMRLAGTGAQLGLSEGDVLGLAAAMSSVGIEAEAGGTAMSMGMKKIDAAVRNSSSELDIFASTAGMSAEEFKTAWGEDAAGTLDLFVQGLARVAEEGGSVSQVLEDVGIKGIREADTFLRLAGASDLLSDALVRGNEAFDENSALAKEAGVRYATTESQVKAAMSSISDSMIDAGAVMLPVVSTIAEAVAGLATAYSELPAPVQGGMTALVGIVGVSALVVGAGMKMVTMASDTAEAMTNLGIGGGKASTALGKVGKAAGIAAVAFVGLEVLKTISNSMAPAATGLEGIASSMGNVAESTDMLDARFKDAEWANGNGHGMHSTVEGINGVGDAITRILDMSAVEKFEASGNALIRFSDKWAAMKEDVSGVDQTLATMVEGGSLDQASEGFRNIADEVEASGGSMADAQGMFSEYEDAVRSLAETYGVQLTKGELMQAMLGEMPPKLQAAIDAADDASSATIDMGEAMEGGGFSLQEMADAAHEAGLELSDLFDAMFALGMVQLDAQAATGKFHESLRATTDAAAEMAGAIRDANGAFDVTTEAGYAAQQAFAGVATSGRDMAEATAAAGGSVGDITGKLSATYDGLVTTAEGFGFTAEQAHNLAREAMGVPDDVSIESWMSDEALRVAAFTGTMAKDIPADVNIDSWMSDSAFIEAIRTKAAAEGIPEHEAISTFMDDVARDKASQTTAAVLGIPEGASVQSWMDENARNEAWRTKEAIDAIPKDVTVTTTHRHLEVWDKTSIGSPKSTGPLKRAEGGRIPAYATGGRLPTSGPGTDKRDGIMGISSMTGEPTAWVDAGEWVINRKASDKYDGLLRAINNDDPRLQSLPGFATGGRVSGRIGGLAARPGEENHQWQARQLEVVKSMEATVGKLADWDIHEDGSGWVRTVDGAMVRIADGAYTVENSTTRAADSMDNSAVRFDQAGYAVDNTAGLVRGAGAAANDAANAMHVTGAEANATAGTFQLAGQAANGTAGAFNYASTITQQAAQAILAATAAIGAAGQARGAAKGGGLRAASGEKDVQWQGRQNAFEASVAKQFGGVKYSDIHEDGSGQMVLDDGRLIELDQGRWKFVKQFKYGAPLHGRTLSRYATGGRIPTSGPGTETQDGFLGMSEMGVPTAMVDAGEWVINSQSSDKYNALLSAVNRDDPAIRHLARHATGGRAGREYATAPVGARTSPVNVSAQVDSAGIEAAVRNGFIGTTVQFQVENRTIHGIVTDAAQAAHRR